MLGRQYRRLMAIQTKQRRDQTRDEYIQIVEINDHGTVVTPPMTQTRKYDSNVPELHSFSRNKCVL